MKINLFSIIAVVAVFFALSVSTAFKDSDQKMQGNVAGAWSFKEGNNEHVLVLQDGYFSHTIYSKTGKKFTKTWGGIYKNANDKLKLVVEFDSEEKEAIGKDKTIAYSVSGKTLHTDISGSHQEWSRIDEGNTNLAGVWRITGRMVDGKINEMPRRDRKTLKLLSGTRFQWIAINPVTKEFFGTGGGTYTFIGGKYTENIEFFSRDSTRVGASLSFDGNVKDSVWNHSGKSSKGEPLNELWTKEHY